MQQIHWGRRISPPLWRSFLGKPRTAIQRIWQIWFENYRRRRMYSFGLQSTTYLFLLKLLVYQITCGVIRVLASVISKEFVCCWEDWLTRVDVLIVYQDLEEKSRRFQWSQRKWETLILMNIATEFYIGTTSYWAHRNCKDMPTPFLPGEQH